MLMYLHSWHPPRSRELNIIQITKFSFFFLPNAPGVVIDGLILYFKPVLEIFLDFEISSLKTEIRQVLFLYRFSIVLPTVNQVLKKKKSIITCLWQE